MSKTLDKHNKGNETKQVKDPEGKSIFGGYAGKAEDAIRKNKAAKAKQLKELGY